jgi:pyruvate,orthophosphate dikinase
MENKGRWGQNPEISHLGQDCYLYKSFPKSILDQKSWPDLLAEMGGKGLSLAIMTALGLNVPEGYTLPVKHGITLYELGYNSLPADLKRVIVEATIQLTNTKGAKFDNLENPLAVAVRSGASQSMPGAMDSILNIGFTKATVDTFAKQIGRKAAMECLHIFCFGWAAAQLGVDKSKLQQTISQRVIESTAETDKTDLYWQEIGLLENWLAEEHGLTIPQSPWEQLYSSILAVYGSYHHFKAIGYRHQEIIAGNGGTAVNVLNMVFGNSGESSGTGVVFSHNPGTGEPGLQIEYVPGGLGDVVVAGGKTDSSQEVEPTLYLQLLTVVDKLMKLTGRPIDVEFVIEKAQLYLVQYRDLRLTFQATLKKIVEEFNQEHENLLSTEKLKLLRKKLPPHLLTNLGASFDREAAEVSRNQESTDLTPRLIARGKPIGNEVHVGTVAFNFAAAEELLDSGDNVALVLTSLQEANQILTLSKKYPSRISIVTLEGNPNSHAAYLVGTENIAGVVGCKNYDFNSLPSGMLSVDGINGEVHLGKLDLKKHSFDGETADLIQKRKAMGVSGWESIVFEFGLEKKLYKIESDIERIIDDFIAGRGVKSLKALTQEAISRIFPSEFITKYHILPAIENNQGDGSSYLKNIEDTVRNGWQKGHDVSIRSAYLFTKNDSNETLGSSPWVIFSPGEEGRLWRFLYGELDDWKYGSLSAWRKNESVTTKLTELLVGYNHAGKLDEELADRHAVGVASSNLGLPNIVSGSVILDTPHLRSYEEGNYDSNQDITYKINLNQSKPGVVLGFGQNHIDRQAVHTLINQLAKVYQGANIGLSPEQKALGRELLKKAEFNQFSQQDTQIDQEKLEQELVKMIEKGDLPLTLLEPVIKE